MNGLTIFGLTALTQTYGLYISDNDQLQNLDGLDALVTVNGSVVLDGLQSVRGLSGLRMIELDLTLGAVANLSGFEALEQVGRNVEFIPNGTPTDVLPALREVGGDLTIRTGAGAVALPSLESIGGTLATAFETSVTEFSVPALTSSGSVQLSGESLATLNFHKLTQTPDLQIYRTALIDLGGFDALLEADSLYVASNPALTRVDAFGALETVHRITISDNPSLAEVRGFGAVTSGLDLLITDNIRLPTCRAEQLRDAFPSPPTVVTIQGNDELGVCN